MWLRIIDMPQGGLLQSATVKRLNELAEKQEPEEVFPKEPWEEEPLDAEQTIPYDGANSEIDEFGIASFEDVLPEDEDSSRR